MHSAVKLGVKRQHMTAKVKGQYMTDCIIVSYFGVIHICIMYDRNETEVIIFHDFGKKIKKILFFLIMATI